jgi:hypothetical protein
MKAARERETFARFAAIASLHVIADSIESREPREPDILCSLSDGNRVAFELVDLVDQDWARNRSLPGLTGVWVGDATGERIRDKLTDREYSTPFPMELVAHDSSGLLLPKDVWNPMWSSEIMALRARSRFRRVWVVDLWEEQIRFVDPPP